jgi:hypothetical protein
MANLFVNNGTTWVSVKQPYVNDAGTFTPAKAVYVHNGTSWTQVFYRFTATLTAAFPYVMTTYDLRTAALADGWNGLSKLNATITIPDYMTILGTGNNASAAFVINNITAGSIVTINNNGIISGSGGSAGYKTSNSGAVSYPGNYFGTFTTPTFANGYNGTGYPVGYGSGGSTPGYNYSSGGTSPNAGSGTAGGSALYLASNVQLIINNNGTFVGGGGGAGGQAGNNAGGGAGGNGGYLIEESGSHPAVVATNSTSFGVILASGGGGSGGWGNRYENDGIGGRPGYAATRLYAGGNVGGNYGGDGISPGLATNNTGTTIINTAGTYTLSPAV